MTAGSGALMEACLTAGVLYHGVCHMLRHLSLENMLSAT